MSRRAEAREGQRATCLSARRVVPPFRREDHLPDEEAHATRATVGVPLDGGRARVVTSSLFLATEERDGMLRSGMAAA